MKNLDNISNNKFETFFSNIEEKQALKETHSYSIDYLLQPAEEILKENLQYF
jgi:hypothetical protein